MITTEELLNWIELNPKKYYKNGQIYGLIGEKRVNNINFLFCVADGVFTYNMIKDIISLYEKETICLVVDTKDEQNQMMKTLSRYQFNHKQVDNIMYSIGVNHGWRSNESS